MRTHAAEASCRSVFTSASLNESGLDIDLGGEVIDFELIENDSQLIEAV
ncbi:MAG: hypothetical protein QG574_4842 [Cyanobacteriota bacterium erpe_2018_sw_21hr_WHONDRS-SW48-000092_B_bin.40]|jgi:hypothetical protein|nr:hypothetical protein [Cyanobacteriota bacterium erpe_2018_sw_21hr_WHONDRS-SW48-000092_B_bin.40]